MDAGLQKAVVAKIKANWYKANILYNNHAKSAGLNFTAILILDILYNANGAYTQKMISDELEQPKQFIHSVITSFWQQGYIELLEAKDRRNKNIILTDIGKAYAQNTLKSLQDAEQRVLDSLTAEEISAFNAILEKTNAIFETQ